MATRSPSSTGALARLGFDDPQRALGFIAAEVLDGLLDRDNDETGLLRAVCAGADPDLALIGLVRLLEAAHGEGHLGQAAHRVAELHDTLRGHDRECERAFLLALLGGSSALADHLVRHPGHWVEAARPHPATPAERTAAMRLAVEPTTRGQRSGEDALRVEYRRQIIGIAARDLADPDPLGLLPHTAAALADLAAAALEAALAVAREEHPQEATRTRLAVIGMGKCGGRELNYVSDVDVIFVAEPAPGVSEEASLQAASVLAATLMRVCSTPTAQGTLWPVDAALRPEGKQGPLVRTVASHRAYYERWAKTWEFQALLKARHVAGDEEVAAAYLDAVAPMVWEAAGRENFVEDVQKMRRRVESHVPSGEAARQLKLGVGGLRDIEFSAQLLQLVHGRTDPSLRVGSTLDALDALAAGGYVAREDAAQLAGAYRLLRALEHRIQVFRMRRTHLMPTAQADLRRLGRSLGERSQPAEAITERWQTQAREVRRIHEALFYRPLLAAVARLSTHEARLTPAAAKDRLAALGYRDPAGALRHLEALTAGTSRTAAIQRTLLPVMLGWFADEADPDAGLLAFRQVSESLGRTHWYLKMLRDEGRAAERLAHVLARSRYAADLLGKSPESVRILGEVEGLQPRTREALVGTMRQAVGRKDDADSALTAVRVVRREELFRIALANLCDSIDLAGVGAALSDLTEAVLESALYVATTWVGHERGAPVPADIALIGMGRLGGRECGFGSDADLMVVHRVHEGADEREAYSAVAAVVQELRRRLGLAGPDPTIGIDIDLRPEGKAGPLSRTIDSYRTYYERWAAHWERQALVRARPVAGDVQLGEEFVELADPLRYPQQGCSSAALTEMRRLKARMESERLPRGADPKTHFKLGRGGLSDVEWTVQMLQMQHGHAIPTLRTTSTLPALAAAQAAGLLSDEDAQALQEAWTLASRLRDAVVLWRIRGQESLPTNVRDAEAVHRIIGGAPGTGADLSERYRRASRRARGVTERVFYGRDAASGTVDHT
ncbi:bifunctional [glutamine synthetase] adenylyltransferase/[glutamine synthetase]-adenylyl-L-tyrosine phosphorylase [Gephyromycinifex aptenodytis]|uniref:bifunctional [glutamine synthetase] adenylyltransferase/[glutamine synthetase]-adenylyl-L-tyrosine phosphorylase n=1 Tax=Gephyromycinifex aptenodytis TaxID=2716227 RepID=UPI001444B9F3|nr:bifunctional [glutamine synthetase] adenylyltransferase/[glutamine synthetase]-adenylyl-L-tyrosine phosphorylase [Gephyromycinifex aptenodytis]